MAIFLIWQTDFGDIAKNVQVWSLCALAPNTTTSVLSSLKRSKIIKDKKDILSYKSVALVKSSFKNMMRSFHRYSLIVLWNMWNMQLIIVASIQPNTTEISDTSYNQQVCLFSERWHIKTLQVFLAVSSQLSITAESLTDIPAAVLKFLAAC